MKISEVRETAFAMPLTSPSFPRGPYRFVNREYVIITYRTDMDALRAVVPEPLKVIPVEFEGKAGGYVHSMYLNDESPIAGGREIWGFPKKLAKPVLRDETDSIVGTLDYGSVRIATATMGFKHKPLDPAPIKASMLTPSFLLKIIPHVDCSPRICELVRYYLEDVTVKGAWSAPARLELGHHALAPVADLPVREIVSAVHILADLTLGLGEVVHDYLA